MGVGFPLGSPGCGRESEAGGSILVARLGPAGLFKSCQHRSRPMDPITYAQAAALADATRCAIVRADVMRLYFAGASMMQVLAAVGVFQGVM